VKPVVSVIVTTYNQARYIGATLRSALAQDFADREIIVVDDGSTDETPAAIAEFQHFVIWVRQENQGVAGSRNSGVRRARGEFLAFLDGDDLWEPRKLSAQVAAARQHPSSGLVVADGVQCNDEYSVLQTSLIAPPIKALLGSSESVTLRCYDHLLAQNVISTSSQILIPRAVLDDVGPSDMHMSNASDWDLYLRIAARYDVTFLRDALVRWRYLPTSVSGPEALRKMRWAADEIGVLGKQLRNAAPQYPPMIRALIKARIFERGYAIYCHGMDADRAFARRQLLRMLRQMPSSATISAFLVGIHLPRKVNRHLKRFARPLVGPEARNQQRNGEHL